MNRDGFRITAVFDMGALPMAETAVKVCEHGFVSLLYRGGASVALAALGAEKASEVEFDADKAQAIADALETWFADGCPAKRGEDVGLPGGITVGITVTRYEHGATAEPKYAREKKKLGEKESAGTLEKWLADFCGYTGDTHGDDGEYHRDALASAKKAIDAFLAKNI